MADKDEIRAGLCDICHRRPAALRVTVSENGRRRTLNVCREDYAQLRAQQASPFESIFGGSLFGDDLVSNFFGDGGAEGRGEAGEDAAAGGGSRRPGRGRGRESSDVTSPQPTTRLRPGSNAPGVPGQSPPRRDFQTCRIWPRSVVYAPGQGKNPRARS